MMNNDQEQVKDLTHCIGTTKGPGESAHEYTFVSPDVKREIKTGEFVYYETQVEGEDDVFTKVDLLLKIGEIHGTQRGDIEAAFDAYSRCFQLDPANETARTELFKLAEIEEAWAKRRRIPARPRRRWLLRSQHR